MEDKLRVISRKLSILISLSLKDLRGDKEIMPSKKQKVGDAANYLANFGMTPQEIAEILNSPVQSIRTLLTPKRRKKN